MYSRDLCANKIYAAYMIDGDIELYLNKHVAFDGSRYRSSPSRHRNNDVWNASDIGGLTLSPLS